MWTVIFPQSFAALISNSTNKLNNFHCKCNKISNSTLRLPQYPIQEPCFNKTSNFSLCCSFSSQGAPAEDDGSFAQEQQESNDNQVKKGFWRRWKESSGEMSSKLAKLGLSAVLGYGIFDAVTYSTFFVLAFLGYEKSTGKNPAANLRALLGIVILMWTGNNVTRPFRVAGAAALAPLIDKGLRRIQNYFKFPSLAYAFALVVSIIGGTCLTIVGLLILSRWGR